MEIAEINRTFLAKDIYRQWQSIIRKAETAITIFTPYFDHILLSLLKANATVDRSQITIVTDISPENALEMPYQLRATKKALSQGISVLSLQGLHAKVLLIDGKRACIGSQNFTRRGRRNREATVLPAAMLGDSRFVRTLHEWRSEAREVTEDEIDELLRQLTSLFRQHKKMHAVINAKVEKVLAQQAQKRNTLLREHLEELEQQSQIRLAQRVVYARLGVRNGNETMLVQNKYDDLTNWVSENPDGSVSPHKLDRLFMYPIILADSNRMGFARIGKGRITYIRNEVNWAGKKWRVGDVWATVSITFPATKTESQNIIAEVTNEYHGSCKFSVSFNGKSVEIKKKHFSKGNFALQSQYDLFVSNITKTLLNSKDALDTFLKKFLEHFRFATLGRDKKNVGTYFEGSWYKICVIQVQGSPFLVFTNYET